MIIYKKNIQKQYFVDNNDYFKLLKDNNFFTLYSKKYKLMEYYQDTVYHDKYNNSNSKNSYNDGWNESYKVSPKVFWKISPRLNYKFFSYKWFYNTKVKILNKRSFNNIINSVLSFKFFLKNKINYVNFFNNGEKFKHNINIYLLKEEFYKVTHKKNLTLIENKVAKTISYSVFNKRSIKIFFRIFNNKLFIQNKNNIYISFAKYFFYISILKLIHIHYKKKNENVNIRKIKKNK